MGACGSACGPGESERSGSSLELSSCLSLEFVPSFDFASKLNIKNVDCFCQAETPFSLVESRALSKGGFSLDGEVCHMWMVSVNKTGIIYLRGTDSRGFVLLNFDACDFGIFLPWISLVCSGRFAREIDDRSLASCYSVLSFGDLNVGHNSVYSYEPNRGHVGRHEIEFICRRCFVLRGARDCMPSGGAAGRGHVF